MMIERSGRLCGSHVGNMCHLLYVSKRPYIQSRVMLQSQTILKHFYKLLMWKILISSNMGSPLISYLCLLIII